VGDSESSQHAKALAVAYLADRSLAGDLTISIENVSETIAAGVQMLLSEGVVRQQGGTSVVWIHDWIREYAMVCRLLDGLDSEAAESLAAAVVSCEDDTAARSAAAGCVKWILSRSGGDEAARYLSELWSGNKGLAREALLVVIEGPGSSIRLADLPEELLLEAVTLAAELGASQWKDQVASLPRGPFFGGVGEELHARVVRFEVEVSSEDDPPTPETVLRLISRDLERLEAGHGSTLGTVRSLLKAAARGRLFHEDIVADWLVRLGSFAHEHDLVELCRIVKAMITQGEVANAGRVFRSVLGDPSSARGKAIAERIATGRGLFAKEIVEVLEQPHLLGGHPDEWAESALALLARIVAAEQQDMWPGWRGRKDDPEADSGAESETAAEFEPNADEHPVITWMRLPGRLNAAARIADSIVKGLVEQAQRDDPQAFRKVAGVATSLGFARVAVLPLLALHDCRKGQGTQQPWQVEEAIRLLTDGVVTTLPSLSDARRLLRRAILGVVSVDRQALLVDAVREAILDENLRLAELSDFSGTEVLADEERRGIESARVSGELDDPSDPRAAGFRMDAGWSDEQEPEPDHGWPGSEDDAAVRYLLTVRPDALGKVGSPDRASALERQLDALGAVLSREVATSSQWRPRVLRWCGVAIEELRRASEKNNEDDGDARFDSTSWLRVLEDRAPWWSDWAEVALQALSGPVCDRHFEAGLESGFLVHHEDDELWPSLNLLDDLLAIDPIGPFEPFRARFIATVRAKWPDWPPSARAIALYCIRPWFWATSPELQGLLDEALMSETRPKVVERALELCLYRARFHAVPALREFLSRVRDPAFRDAVRRLARFLGGASVRSRLADPPEAVKDAADLLEELICQDGLEPELLNLALDGAVHGGGEYVAVRRPASAELLSAWTEFLRDYLAFWDFDQSSGRDLPSFPVSELLAPLSNDWTSLLRSKVFLVASHGLEAATAKGSLGDFCDIHHYVVEVIEGGVTGGTAGPGLATGLRVTKEVEEGLVRLARVSVERVASWARKGKTTDDFGWYNAIDGSVSARLIRTIVDASHEREHLARQLTPLADILADAGRRRVAAELRAFLRRA
jgi:hypothetical protein